MSPSKLYCLLCVKEACEFAIAGERKEEKKTCTMGIGFWQRFHQASSWLSQSSTSISTKSLDRCGYFEKPVLKCTQSWFRKQTFYCRRPNVWSFCYSYLLYKLISRMITNKRHLLIQWLLRQRVNFCIKVYLVLLKLKLSLTNPAYRIPSQFMEGVFSNAF